MTAPDSVPLHALTEDNLASTSPDLLRAMIKTFADALMSSKADAACGPNTARSTTNTSTTATAIAFRNRPLDQGPYTFVWVDALTQKAREGGRIINVHAAGRGRCQRRRTARDPRPGRGHRRGRRRLARLSALPDRPRPHRRAARHLRRTRRTRRRHRRGPARCFLAAMPHPLRPQPAGKVPKSAHAEWTEARRYMGRVAATSGGQTAQAVGLSTRTTWRLLYESAARAKELLCLNVEDLFTRQAWQDHCQGRRDPVDPLAVLRGAVAAPADRRPLRGPAVPRGDLRGVLPAATAAMCTLKWPQRGSPPSPTVSVRLGRHFAAETEQAGLFTTVALTSGYGLNNHPEQTFASGLRIRASSGSHSGAEVPCLFITEFQQGGTELCCGFVHS